MKITTNNVPRPLIDAYELTAAERLEFDYLDWTAIDHGLDSATFFRYKGELHDLGEFSTDYGITHGSGLPSTLTDWDGYRSDSAFSALVVRLTEDNESIVVGWMLS